MKTKKAVIKRQRILTAAAKLFGTKGYSETTLADIGAEAGTYAGSLYYYFPSKESIVEEVLNIGTTSVSNLVMGKVAMLPPDTSVRDRIRVALETHMEQMLQRDEFVIAYWKIIDQVPEEIRQRHLVLPRAYGRFWQGMLNDAQMSGEIRSDLNSKLLRLLLIGSTIYALDWFNPDGQYTPTEIADALAEMFFFGVLPRSKSTAKTNVSLVVDRDADEADEPVVEAEVARALAQEPAKLPAKRARGRSSTPTRS